MSAIPEATVARLPTYLRALTAMVERGVATASSEELAAAAGVNSAKLRKDLSYLGSYGTRGVGYDLEYLRYQIAREIGLTQDWPVVIVGVGNLGHALANYSGFASRGFGIVGLLDADPGKAGEKVGDHVVRAYDELEDVVQRYGVAIGVIATPAGAAQDVCDRMVAAGISSVLNFAPVVLSVPERVDVRKVDLASELQILAYHEQRKAGGVDTLRSRTVSVAQESAGDPTTAGAGAGAPSAAVRSGAARPATARSAAQPAAEPATAGSSTETGSIGASAREAAGGEKA